ncbi:MAG: hypothetical protein WA102_01300 [Candidatus Methanoperedens sp.]
MESKDLVNNVKMERNKQWEDRYKKQREEQKRERKKEQESEKLWTYNLWKYGVDALKLGFGGMLFFSIAAVGRGYPQRPVDFGILPVLFFIIALLGVLLCLIGGIGKIIHKLQR